MVVVVTARRHIKHKWQRVVFVVFHRNGLGYVHLRGEGVMLVDDRSSGATRSNNNTHTTMRRTPRINMSRSSFIITKSWITFAMTTITTAMTTICIGPTDTIRPHNTGKARVIPFLSFSEVKVPQTTDSFIPLSRTTWRSTLERQSYRLNTVSTVRMYPSSTPPRRNYCST